MEDTLIAPEIAGDNFAAWLTRLCQTEELTNVLEIGSSSGAGSTAAIVEGLQKNPDHPRLFCIEIMRSRYKALIDRFGRYDFVVCYRASSVPPEAYVREHDIAKFIADVDTELKRYGLGAVLRWRAQELAYIRENVDVTDGIDRIKSDFGIEYFDLVLIDGSEFTGMAEFKRIHGARWILLDDIRTLKTYSVCKLLKQDPDYELVHEDPALRNGFAVFRRRPGRANALPIHFFTTVLNGEPFIRHHSEEFSKLPFRWHWHIIEGVAEHQASSEAAATPGLVSRAVSRGGLSSDGTSEYLDELQRRMPDRVSIYRKPFSQVWNGKLEMYNAAIAGLAEECLLWRLDVDEIWAAEQIEVVRAAFTGDPNRSAARYWCNVFVGPARIISTRYNCAENSVEEGLRTWRFKPGMQWHSRSQPVLVMNGENDVQGDVAAINPFSQDEMEERGAVFDHCAYVLESQVALKETCYGYAGAVGEWKSLQEDPNVPGFLADHLSWVSDRAMFDDAARRFVAPATAVGPDSKTTFVRSKAAREQEVAELRSKAELAPAPRILIDGLCFQTGDPIVVRMWSSFLEGWLSSGFAQNVVLLDRGGTAPRFRGLTIRSIRPYVSSPFGEDQRFLQKVCDEEAATLFVSTGASFPIQTPSAYVAAEPPASAASDLDPKAERRDYAVLHASALVAFSGEIADELARRKPGGWRDKIRVVQPGPLPNFVVPAAKDLKAFLKANQLDQPYVIQIGERHGPEGDRNAGLLFKALAQIPLKARPLALCIGGGPDLESELAAIDPDTRVRLMNVDTAEFPFVYAGAMALINTAVRENANITVLEAMACGCPVVAVKNPLMEALIGNAGALVDWDDADAVSSFLAAARGSAARAPMVTLGLSRAAASSHGKAAAELAEALDDAVQNLRSGAVSLPSSLWPELIERERKVEEQQRLSADAVELRGQLENKNEALVAESSASVAALANLQLEHQKIRDEASDEIASLHKQLAEARNQHTTFSAEQIASLQQRLSAAESQHDESLAALAKLQVEHVKANREVANLRDIRTKLETQLNGLRQNLAQNADELADAARARRELDEMVARQATMLSALRQNLAQNADELAEAARARHELDEMVARQATMLSALRQNLTQSADEIADAARARAELDEAVVRQASEIARLDRIMVGLRRTLAEAERRKEARRAELEGMRLDLQNQKLTIASLNSDFASERLNFHARIFDLNKTIEDIHRSPVWRLRSRIDSLLRVLRLRRRPRAFWERSDVAN